MFFNSVDWDLKALINECRSYGACEKPLQVIAKDVKKKKIPESKANHIFQNSLRALDMPELIKRYKPENADKLTPKKSNLPIYGAMYGDYMGSPFEGHRISEDQANSFMSTPGKQYTDDSILTLATMHALEKKKMRHPKIRNNITVDTIYDHETIMSPEKDIFAHYYRTYGLKHKEGGYGPAFYSWLSSKINEPYGSNGNGSAMRISPIGAAGLPYEDTVKLAILSACCTHDHIEGVRGAVVEAISIWLACCGCSVDDIYAYMKHVYEMPGENLFHDFTMEEVKNIRFYQIQCQFSVPAAIIAVYEGLKYGYGFYDAIKNALLAGRDTDTNACIAAAIAAPLCEATVVEPIGKYIISEIERI